MIRRRDVEIMAPAGSWASFMAAVQAGADSVYFGVGDLNMRSRSTVNFTLEDLPGIALIARENNVRTYLTVNIVFYDAELGAMRELIDAAWQAGIDAVIASDQAAILYARMRGMEVHISTQLNVSNLETLRFYSQWADVVVLARELSLEQVKYIHQQVQARDIRGPRGELVKIEMFAHGALCMAVSGKCYLSLHESGCSANRGSCRQLCRRSFTLSDTDTGAQLQSEGNYLLSPKDLCTLPFLDRMIDAGVRVLKIEGRARSEDYVKKVVECYSQALDYLEADLLNRSRKDELTARLAQVFNRGFWGGYYLGSPVAELSEAYGSSATKRRVYVGRVTNFFKNISVAEIAVEAVPLNQGDELIVTGETTGVYEICARQIYVEDAPAETVPQGTRCSIRTEELVRRGDKVYKIVDASMVTG